MKRSKSLLRWLAPLPFIWLSQWLADAHTIGRSLAAAAIGGLVYLLLCFVYPILAAYSCRWTKPVAWIASKTMPRMAMWRGTDLTVTHHRDDKRDDIVALKWNGAFGPCEVVFSNATVPYLGQVIFRVHWRKIEGATQADFDRAIEMSREDKP